MRMPGQHNPFFVCLRLSLAVSQWKSTTALHESYSALRLHRKLKDRTRQLKYRTDNCWVSRGKLITITMCPKKQENCFRKRGRTVAIDRQQHWQLSSVPYSSFPLFLYLCSFFLRCWSQFSGWTLWFFNAFTNKKMNEIQLTLHPFPFISSIQLTTFQM